VRFLGATRIRAVESGDLAATRRWRNDPAVVGPALGRRFPITEIGEQQWFASLGLGEFPTKVVWAICATEDSSIVGLGQIFNIDWIHRTAEFGIWIGTEFWGHGHGPRATQLITEHALTDLGLRQIRLHVLPNNTRAVKTYERLGFRLEATLSAAVLYDGAATDLHIMCLDSSPDGKRHSDS
jgi:diamine N-acetyltransferase